MSVIKAGCILLDLESKKVGLIYRDKLDDYSFPKGHVEENESIEECAIRETEEETGRKCHIISKYKRKMFQYMNNVDGEIKCYYYLAIDDGESEKVFSDDLVHELKWLDYSSVQDMLTYDDLKKLWNDVKENVLEVFNEK